jgi:hypothetical protein
MENENRLGTPPASKKDRRLRAVGVFSSSWIAWTVSGNTLALDFLAISDTEDQNHQTVVFDLADEPVTAQAIFPELSKSRVVQRLSDAAWKGGTRTVSRCGR